MSFYKFIKQIIRVVLNFKTYPLVNKEHKLKDRPRAARRSKDLNNAKRARAQLKDDLFVY